MLKIPVVKGNINIERNIFDIFQVERRITASVPPDNSMNAIE